MSEIASLLVKYLIGLAGITIVVVIHEIGHLVAAKIHGIEVEIFSFGLGPKVLGKLYKGTEYRISLFPMGGYCRLKGSDDLSQAIIGGQRTFTHTEEGSLFSVHPSKRMITYLAGPLANFIFAILLYAVLATLPMQVVSRSPVAAVVDDYPALFGGATSPASEAGMQSGDEILKLNGEHITDWEDLESRLTHSKGTETFTVKRNNSELVFTVSGEKNEDGSYRFGLTVLQQPMVGSVRPNSAEYHAGLRGGDFIIAVDGKPVANHLDLLLLLNADKDPIQLTVLRDGSEVLICFTPKLDESGALDLQFSLAAGTVKREGLPFSIIEGYQRTKQIVDQTFTMLAGLFSRDEENLRSSVTGMARSALLIGDITTLGLEQNTPSGLYALFYLMGGVSISLAIANLIPLPAFDGGQVMIALGEWVRKKQIRPKTYYVLQLLGVVCIIGIFLLLTLVDVRHLLAIRR
jgi:regulator of sigma E protease